MQEMQETQVQSLDQEAPLEEEMTTTPVFLPGKSHGQRSLAGHSPWSHKELDMIQWLSMHAHFHQVLFHFTDEEAKCWEIMGLA